MQITQASVLRSLRAIQAFLDGNAASLGAIAQSGTRKRLDEIIAELSGHVSEQGRSVLASQGATRKQRELRETLLRDHMAPVARIAVADLPKTAELEPFRMPDGRPKAERLVQLAHAMADQAASHENVFVTAGLPVDFAAQLHGAADNLLASVNDRIESRGKHGGATDGLKTKITAARKVVRVLDSFVKSALKKDAALLGTWKRIKRVERPTGRAAAQPEPSAPTVEATKGSTQEPTLEATTPTQAAAAPAPTATQVAFA